MLVIRSRTLVNIILDICRSALE
uniref:Uncharacterized protein n=1 Tax=Arundo donax TaxID=35708 RepID=A0A0A9HPW9_ARUDO